ncbi:MAG: methylthioribulose 1-phosphate dehydratase [Aquificaceae bacterium]|nr:methylthioribulose 1-phosphate dehydratase [Aquificaceae bacterium]MCX8059902.1 methylthioribulose 1-phosphate dehydratase [Aquificaceae bacterium]MDW8097409.1 methylthioribulose 1-phosphate dehydratase [Aquificaceae bacterium]
MQGEIAELIEVGRRLHLRGWLPASSGNLSAKLGEGRVLITASGVHKGHLTCEDFVVVDWQGRQVEGSGKPSAETLLHLAVYRSLPQVGSVLHVHSVSSTLLSRLAQGDVKLENYELLKAFGIGTHEACVRVPVFENSQDMRELSQQVEQRLKQEQVYGFLLRSHGLYAWGRSVEEAYMRLEALEFLLECELRLALSLKYPHA